MSNTRGLIYLRNGHNRTLTHLPGEPPWTMGRYVV